MVSSFGIHTYLAKNWLFIMNTPYNKDFQIDFTLVYLIAEQDVLSEQALNSKIHPARFLLSTYEVSNKRAGTK